MFKGGESIIGFFSDSSDAKSFCAKQSDVINANTEYAAKKANKACLERF